MVLKFSPAGKFLMQIGAPGKIEGPGNTMTLNRPTAMDFDAAANEVYIADTGNRRIVVFDMDTGAYKRHWGAYGNKPDMTDLGPYDPGVAPATQFRYLSCVHIAKDAMVYVCDKIGDRIQVFQKDGKFVREALISNQTTGGSENGGAVWDIAFSKDPQQRYLYVADGTDKKIFVVQRNSLLVLNTFGQGGRLAGEFVGVGSLAVDSKGNLFTGETFEGKRVQRWVLK
jgi:DNA-binding beta-propeller fold protein YncE